MPAADAANAINRKPVVGAPEVPGFNVMDLDRDGRISLTEFTAPSAAWLRGNPGASGTGISSDNMSGKAPPPIDPSGRRGVTGQKLLRAASAPWLAAKAANNAQLFQQIDTDHDGYLSQAELDAYRMPATSER